MIVNHAGYIHSTGEDGTHLCVISARCWQGRCIIEHDVLSWRDEGLEARCGTCTSCMPSDASRET